MESNDASAGPNLHWFLEQLDGDLGLLNDLIDVFLRESPQHIVAMRKALERGDGDQLRRAAHTLRGSAANFGDCRVVTLARETEQLGRNNNLSQARGCLTALEAAVASMREDLAAFRKGVGH